MAVLSHNHDWSATVGGYQCQGCSAFVPDGRADGQPPLSNGEDSGIDWVWYSVIGGS